MMKRNFNIDNYLAEADEQFSGFDGMDDYDYMSGDDYSETEGMSQPTEKSPTPYQVIVTNTTAGALTAVLFGKNKYLLTTNFGSSAALIVTPAQTNISYLELLQQSADQPFETSLIRIQSDKNLQITEILTVTVKDANGQSATLPIITQSYFSAYQQQSGILDIPYRMKVDANTYITTNILAGSTTTYTFFPSEKVNVAKGLSGAHPVKVYGNPQVNLGGMSFPRMTRGHRANERRRLT